MSAKRGQFLKLYRSILAYIKTREVTTSQEEKKWLWDKVIQAATYRERQKRHRIYTAIATAAVIAGAIIWFQVLNTVQQEEKLNTVVAEIPIPKQSSDIIIMVSDSNEIRIDKDTAVVSYTGNGDITINNQSVISKKETREVPEKESYNQIIVPGGKRTMLTLSDSTRVWINAGSRVVFPNKFGAKERRIFVDGEAYLEVAKNAQKPFIVETPAKFDIEVLGTSFNVCTYAQLEQSSVVLAEGKIALKGENNQHKTLKPNELIQIDKEGTLGDIVSVDASEYSSWTKGLLVVNSQPFSEVVKRLQIYFGVSMEIDPGLNKRISGELELKEKLEDILNGLRNIVSYNYAVDENGKYSISSASPD